jgi:2-oxoglutarate dehydrogenase E1 component
MEQQSPNVLSLPFVEALYADYLRDPTSVPPVWQRYFAGIGESNGFASRPQLSPSFPRQRLFGKPGAPSPAPIDEITNGSPKTPSAPASAAAGGRQTVAPAPTSVEALVRSYRARGHLVAKIDPLGLMLGGHQATQDKPPAAEPIKKGHEDRL